MRSKKANPKKAVTALLPPPLRCGDAVVRPMTLGMWAALESIESPLITGRGPSRALELVPSLYLLTHDPREVFRADFLDAAMSWADTQPVGALERIRAACDRQVQIVQDVMPQCDEEDEGKKTTGRSPTSRAGRPATSNGPGAK